jgi:hypothetical protein
MVRSMSRRSATNRCPCRSTHGGCHDEMATRRSKKVWNSHLHSPNTSAEDPFNGELEVIIEKRAWALPDVLRDRRS